MRPAKRWVIAIALGAAALPGCDQGPLGPGTLAVALITPHADDGAVVFELHGEGLERAEPAAVGYRAFSRKTRSGELRVVVFGDLAAGPVVTVAIAELSAAGAVRGAVIEVARRDDTLREDLSGYGVRVRRTSP